MSADHASTIQFELHSDDKRIKQVAFGVAVLLHVTIMFIPLPEVAKIIPEKPKNAFFVRQHPLPPPKIERRPVAQLDLQRLIPVPDLTPHDPEPIREPAPVIEPEPYPPDATFMIGSPPTPPQSGPRVVDGHHVTAPQRIEESAVKPVYPEIARMARAEGRVIIQAVILKDGSVADIEVLDCTPPGMQFEEAAIEAVKQWRYSPAMQGNRPVDVFFTVVVEFDLS
jgi:protein TonB